MLISVIIPCYNVEDYIEDCVSSVISQTYENLEIICVDNNSSDNTLSKLQYLKKHYADKKIILLEQKKIGAPATRNLGLQKATGNWIQFLDADDLLLRDKISHQMGLVHEKYDVPFVVGSCIRKKVTGEEIVITPASQAPWLLLPEVNLGNTCANLFNRKYLEKINGWDENLKSSQEYDLMFRLLQKNDQVIFDSVPLTIIRERVSGSITQSDLLGNNLRRLQHLQQIKEHLLLKKFSKRYLQNVDQHIFQEIRRIYRLDPNKALNLYKDAFPRKKPNIKPTDSTSKIYTWLFRFLDFKSTQSINRLYQKIK